MSRNHAKKTVSPAVDRPLPTESPLPDEPRADTPTSVAVAERPKAKAKAKPKSPATSTTTDLVSEELAREERLARAREELTFRRFHLLQEGGDLSSSEMSLLQSAFPRRPELDQAIWCRGWDRHLRHENARVGQVLDLQSRAGTPADQTRADKLAESTAAKLDAEAPAMEEQIRELQNQIGAMQVAATNAKMAAIARHAATNSLQKKELLPIYIVDELNSLIQKHGRSFHHELQQLEGRQVSLVSLIALDVDESPEVVKNHIGGNSRFGADHIERLKSAFTFSTEQRPGGVSHRFGNLRPGVWESYCQELGEELATVEARMAEIANGPQAAADAAVEQLKSHYVPK